MSKTTLKNAKILENSLSNMKLFRSEF